MVLEKFDQPSEAALEWQKEQEEKRKERKVWESVEMQMRREAEEAEQRAAFQLKREIAASSGTPPDAAIVAKAFASLGGAPEPVVKRKQKWKKKLIIQILRMSPIWSRFVRMCGMNQQTMMNVKKSQI